MIKSFVDFMPIVVFLFFAFSLNYLTKIFGINKRKIIIFLLPLAFYVLGYFLRLSGNKNTIDYGFFLTDYSVFYIWTLLALFSFLGQLKYWKQK